MPASSVPFSNSVFCARKSRDAGERRGAGPAVHERDPVEEDRRRERAEHEVLHAGFERAQPAAVEGGEHVQRDRERLERDEHDDEVVGRGHHEHAGRREQQEREVLGSREAFAPQVLAREQERHGRREHDDDAEEHGEAVDAHHPRHGRDRAVVADVHPLPGEGAAGGEQSPDRQRECDARGPGSVAQQGAEQDDEDARADEREHRGDREPVDRRGGDGLDDAHHFEPAPDPPSSEPPESSTLAMPGGFGSR